MKKNIFTFLFLIPAFAALAATNIDAPALTAPANGASNIAPYTLLDWGAVAGAWTYKIEYSIDSNFTTSDILNTGSTAVYVSDLLFGEIYYWRVKAIGFTDSSAWSARWSFTTRDLVSITAPLTGAVEQTPVVEIKWTAIAGVTAYQWEVDSAMTFDSPLKRSDIIASPTVVTNTRQLYFGQNYYLRMRTMHSADTSSWSSPITFATLDSFALLRPSSNFDTLHVVALEVRWTYVKSTYYDIAFSLDSNMTSPQIVTVDSSSVARNLAQVIQYAKATSPTLLFDTVYYWSVRARNVYDTTDWVEIRKFKTLNTVTLSSPANGATTTTVPELKWVALKNTDHYILQLDTVAGFTNPVEYIVDTNLYKITDELEAFTTYYWRVKSITAVDTSGWSSVWSMETGAGIGIAEASFSNESISMFPNPCSGRLNVDIESTNSGQLVMSISNIIGETVFSKNLQLRTGKNNLQFNLDHLVSGIYLVKFEGADKTITKKLVIDR